MPRYYFDLLDENAMAIDKEGIELPHIRAAQAEAAKSLADMARDAIHTSASSKRHHMAIEVRDAGGPIMQVRFTFEIQRLKH